MTKTIKITCRGSKNIPLDVLENFQGNLKELRTPEFEKLKSSILKYGVSFPVFVWGTKILDGHQRVFVIKKLVEGGYKLGGDVPVAEIEATNEKEAAEKLLLLTSHYAKITDDGLYEFINNYNIDLSDLPEIELPDIDIDKFMEGYSGGSSGDNGDKNQPSDNYAEQYGVIVICDNEDHQEQVYNELSEAGHKCRVVNT